ncbi:hypothetical protein D3C76_1787100 [compost metagenome]
MEPVVKCAFRIPNKLEGERGREDDRAAGLVAGEEAAGTGYGTARGENRRTGAGGQWIARSGDGLPQTVLGGSYRQCEHE